ncbi:RluA family pseudouridine synthase [Nonlabens marinus]|uniref:Pseudouridine synthase n=1 Tax=Nonlabens marinus S1-08 TaxID=1454201 RepID=W8VZB0_9FLAO|nr:RluA family pseudouridine synthase [Nonlabens marinus]BAO54261.1 ribosomal large subunit pseudouridine synthase D [Nonlabens marinus S1-08]
MTDKETDSDLDHEDLHEHYHFTAKAGQKPLRVDKFLMNFIEDFTRSKIQAAIKDGGVRVNDEVVKSNYKVKPGDEVRVLMEHPTHEQLLVAENIPLDIVYEDDTVVVVNKPSGMVVHPGHGNYAGTLINALIYHFENLPNNSSERPGLVHRIDKDTSGLLVVAKTEQAMAHLSAQFAAKTSEREYVAIAWGNFDEQQGTIEGNIGRHPKNRLQNTVWEGEESDKGKPAVTHYEVLEDLGYVTVIKCKLETGRTHQIRVHMKYIGHTLFNDERYGGDRILKGTNFTKYKQFVDNCFKILPRQALHAKTLGFEHPVTKEWMRFNSEVPEDMTACINKWRSYASNSLQEL